MIDKNESEIIREWPAGFIDNPVVSIRCTTYNHSRYVAQALDSFLMQKTQFPFEIIIHDDASTDNTQDIIHEYHERFPSIIKPILQIENQYSKPNGREYLKSLVDGACKGKYIAWCEGDDYWINETKLQKQVDYLEANPDCSMVFNSANYIDENGLITKCDRKTNKECDFSVEDVIRGGGLFCSSPSLCLRSEYSKQLFYFQSLADIGDYPLQIALSLKGRIHYFPEVMSVYRVASNNSTSWTNRVMKRKENAIKHLNTEINWLNELDDETEHKYSNAIAYRIFITKCFLYQNEAIKKRDLINGYLQLSFSNKILFIRKLFKKALRI